MSYPNIGYGSGEYIEAIRAGRRILELPGCGGRLLVDAIPGSSGRHDAAGAYPVFCCLDWAEIQSDLLALERAGDIVATWLVADPLASFSPHILQRSFDFARPFKKHFVVELAKRAPSEHHLKEARKARRRLELTELTEPSRFASQWVEMYAGLIRSKRITGPARFTPDSLCSQLAAPGIRAFGAFSSDLLCAMQLWMADGENAYYHLSASNDLGRRMGAGYALMDFSLTLLARDGLRLANLGGVPSGADSSGLQFFKRGWANFEAQALLCGRVFDRAIYAALSNATGAAEPHFPAYRAPKPSLALE